MLRFYLTSEVNLEFIIIASSIIKKCEYYQLLVKDDKQKMDNNIYGHQPYSVRLENMNKLSNSIADFQQHLDTFSNVVKNLEIERIKCIGNIEGYINYLRLSQIILEKSNLPALEKRYKETINNIEDLISRIKSFVKMLDLVVWRHFLNGQILLLL